jgi:hypothetical protein
MYIKSLALLLVGTALIASPVLAQNSKTDESSHSASTKQQNASETGLWQASKLIGLNVYNDQNEKIGDIKQLMVSKSGNVDDVVIGVGGFLGVGERDVAVKFGQLKWSNEPVRSTSSSNNKGTSTTGSSQTSNKENGSEPRTYPDHAVWNTTKDKVQSMPQFNYNK